MKISITNLVEEETRPQPVVKPSYIDNRYDLFNDDHHIYKEK